jgi:phosphatidylinositol alpha-1,6-mannosyltransferase
VKRPFDLLNSAEEVLSANPNVTYLIVGTGPLYEKMKELCKRRGLSAKFRFAGWIEYSLIPGYINLADMVIMPSEREGLSRVYLETLACARVLIASDIPAAREVIKHGKTGLLFRKGDIGDLTGKTLTVLSDFELRKKIGRGGRNQVTTYSLDNALAAYSSSFRKVIQTHRDNIL